MPSVHTKELKLKFADIILCFTSNVVDLKLPLDDPLNLFVVDEGTPDAIFHVHYGIPHHILGKKVFDSEAKWRLYWNNENYIIRLAMPNLGPDPYELAIVSPDFRSGNIYVKEWESVKSYLPHPIGFPLDELLMIILLVQNKGLLVHSCCIDDHGRGLLFAGFSGAGKSTIAEIWHGMAGVQLLTDDRTIIRKMGNQFWAYGTPWHGSAIAYSAKGVPLDRIFFLKHAPENSCIALGKMEATTAIITRSFITLWDEAGMKSSLELIDEISGTIPCYELGFVPDKNIIDFVRSIK